MEIIAPAYEYQASYNAYIDELGDEERYPYPMDLPHQDFAALIQRLNDFSKGVNLPENLVPNSTFWLVDEGDIVAVSHLRHYLNESLAKAGGHIGIGVRPSMRGMGLGVYLLKLTIQKAISMGINACHIHCYQNNPASVNMIEKVGAEIDSVLTLQTGPLNDKNLKVCRYIYYNKD